MGEGITPANWINKGREGERRNVSILCNTGPIDQRPPKIDREWLRAGVKTYARQTRERIGLHSCTAIVYRDAVTAGALVYRDSTEIGTSDTWYARHGSRIFSTTHWYTNETDAFPLSLQRLTVHSPGTLLIARVSILFQTIDPSRCVIYDAGRKEIVERKLIDSIFARAKDKRQKRFQVSKDTSPFFRDKPSFIVSLIVLEMKLCDRGSLPCKFLNDMVNSKVSILQVIHSNYKGE